MTLLNIYGEHSQQGEHGGGSRREVIINSFMILIPLIFNCFSLPPSFFTHFTSLSTLQTHSMRTRWGWWDGGGNRRGWCFSTWEKRQSWMLCRFFLGTLSSHLCAWLGDALTLESIGGGGEQNHGEPGNARGSANFSSALLLCAQVGSNVVGWEVEEM